MNSKILVTSVISSITIFQIKICPHLTFSVDADVTVPYTMWSVVIGGWIFFLSIYGTNQQMVQRYLSTERKSSAVWYETVERNLNCNMMYL